MLRRTIERLTMKKIVVIGGTGLIGSKVVADLTAQGHQAVAASPNSGVNTLTGEGLADVLVGADVVIDVSNSPSFEEQAVLSFFTTSTTNLLAAAHAAGVGHYVALSVVGTERLTESAYFRAKIAQEELIRNSGAAYSIVHATQFFEFVRGIADSATVDGTVRLSSALIRPIASSDVAAAVAGIALEAPINDIREIAGPQEFGLEELIATALRAQDDPRDVVVDPTARYFGAVLDDRTLVPRDNAVIYPTTFAEWAESALPVA